MGEKKIDIRSSEDVTELVATLCSSSRGSDI